MPATARGSFQYDMVNQDLEISCDILEFITSERPHTVESLMGANDHVKQQIKGVFASIPRGCLRLDGQDLYRKEFFLHPRLSGQGHSFAGIMGVYVSLVESRELFPEHERAPERVKLRTLGVAVLEFDNKAQ